MRQTAWLVTAALLSTACAREDRTATNQSAAAEQPAAAGPAATPTPRWDLRSSGEGVALTLRSDAGKTAIRMVCETGGRQLLVNVPLFRPIGSEERLSFGSRGEAVALVADSRGDARRGGVSATAAVPGNLAELVGGPISASYGAQASGPHPAPASNLARAFVAACSEKPAPAPVSATHAPTPASACLTQDGRTVPANRLRAIGTEPFWGARIEGRCVTYSHPEDQQGTRVWTRFGGTATSGSWSGSLGGSRFVLRTRPQPGCSDGMSDNRYPIAVSLTVGGEERTGCAEPL